MFLHLISTNSIVYLLGDYIIPIFANPTTKIPLIAIGSYFDGLYSSFFDKIRQNLFSINYLIDFFVFNLIIVI